MTTSAMAREIAEVPHACARLLSGAPDAAIRAAAAALRTHDPDTLVTVGRGSSDHAATWLSYACGMISGVIPASYPLSLASLHGQAPRANRAAAFAISQSGASPDIVAAARALAAGGATLVVLTNTPESPLAALPARCVDIAAGPERAVAATKSYVASVVAGLCVLGHWHGRRDLLDAIAALPDALGRPAGTGDLVRRLTQADRLVVLGRGPSLGLAQEVALKAMELCQIPAQAFSAAEVQHGPMQALRDGFPVLDLAGGAALPGTDTFRPPPRGASLHPLLNPLLDAVPLYVALEAAARARGLDPDAPDRLTKETRTR